MTGFAFGQSITVPQFNYFLDFVCFLKPCLKWKSTSTYLAIYFLLYKPTLMGGSQWELMVVVAPLTKKKYSEEMTTKKLLRSLFALNLSSITSLIFLIPSSSKHVFASISLDRCCTFSYLNLYLSRCKCTSPESRSLSAYRITSCQFSLCNLLSIVNFILFNSMLV